MPGTSRKAPGELIAERYGNNRREKIRVYQRRLRERRLRLERYGNNRTDDPGYTRSGEKDPVKLGIRWITG
ncbi:unnamed protein product [Sphagnum balticum]